MFRVGIKQSLIGFEIHMLNSLGSYLAGRACINNWRHPVAFLPGGLQFTALRRPAGRGKSTGGRQPASILRQSPGAQSTGSNPGPQRQQAVPQVGLRRIYYLKRLRAYSWWFQIVVRPRTIIMKFTGKICVKRLKTVTRISLKIFQVL